MAKPKSLEELRNAFKQNESSNDNYPNNYYPFWQMPEGTQAVVRFLPDVNEDNPMGFMVEKYMHNLVINGEKKNVPCMKMYGEECPICKVSKTFYDKDDKENGKKYWRKRQYLTQALIVKDPLPKNEDGESYEGKVCCIALGFQLYQIINDAIMSDDELSAMPYMFKDGVDFIIKKSKQGEYSTYALGSKFMRNSRSLTDDEVALATAEMIDLSTLLPKQPTLEFLQESLSAALNSDDNVTHTATTSSYDNSDSMSSSSQDVSSDDEGNDEADAILAEIRNRKNAG